MSRFVENQAGIRRQAFHPGLSAALYARAREIAAEARQLSPSDRVAREIKAETPEADQHGMMTRVNAHHWTSAFVEFGTIYQRPAAMLRRAAEASGRFTGRTR